MIAENESVFAGINSVTSPINALLDSSSSGQIKISESLKHSLFSIEDTKKTLLGSDSFTALNGITDNYKILFSDASKGFINNFEGIKANNEISKYLYTTDGILGIKKKDKE